MLHASLSELAVQYYEMLRIRMVEEAIADRYSEQQIRCPVHLSIGQEAIAIGVCAHLRTRDYVVSNHRAHAHYLAKGGDLKAMLAEIYGRATGCCQGRGGSMHLVDLAVGFLGSTSIMGGSIPIGVGAAFASSLKGEDRITTIFFGEGATEEGAFSESLNFAVLKKLPILFVCENNLYPAYSPLHVRQPENRYRPLIAEGHGLYALEGNGNNVEEVYSLTEQALSYIKEGMGPCYLEFSTYRHQEHCGPHLDPYRPSEDASQWLEKDPLLLYIPPNIEEMRHKISQEIEEAFAFAEASPYPFYDSSQESTYA